MISQHQSTWRRTRLVAWVLAPVIGAVTALALGSPAQAALLPCEATYRYQPYWSLDNPWTEALPPPPPTGFHATVDITNTGTENFQRWTVFLNFDEPFTLEFAYNAEAFPTRRGFLFDNAAWMVPVVPGDRKTFGFKTQRVDPSVPRVPTRMTCYGFSTARV